MRVLTPELEAAVAKQRAALPATQPADVIVKQLLDRIGDVSYIATDPPKARPALLDLAAYCLALADWLAGDVPPAPPAPGLATLPRSITLRQERYIKALATALGLSTPALGAYIQHRRLQDLSREEARDLIERLTNRLHARSKDPVWPTT